MRISDKILIVLSIAFVCVYVGAPEIKQTQADGDACKIFDESGYPSVEREARRADDAARASFNEKREVAYRKFVETLDATMAVSGVTVQLYRLDPSQQNATIHVWLRVPDCEIQFLSTVQDTEEMRKAVGLPPTTKAKVYGKVIEDYLRPYVLRIAVSRIVLPDGTRIEAEPPVGPSGARPGLPHRQLASPAGGSASRGPSLDLG
jgi:hypothetical protein